jgi:hypothetical protein
MESIHRDAEINADASMAGSYGGIMPARAHKPACHRPMLIEEETEKWTPQTYQDSRPSLPSAKPLEATKV